MTLLELRFEVEICDTIKCVITIDLSLMTLKKKKKKPSSMLQIETNINAHFLYVMLDINKGGKKEGYIPRFYQ